MCNAAKPERKQTSEPSPACFPPSPCVCMCVSACSHLGEGQRTQSSRKFWASSKNSVETQTSCKIPLRKNKGCDSDITCVCLLCPGLPFPSLSAMGCHFLLGCSHSCFIFSESHSPGGMEEPKEEMEGAWPPGCHPPAARWGPIPSLAAPLPATAAHRPGLSSLS